MMLEEARKNFVSWCRRERDENSRLVYLISSGTMTTGKNDGTGRKDTTSETLAVCRRIVADMEDLIARVEAEAC